MTRHKHYTRHTQGGKWIRPEKRLAIYIRDGFCCSYCGKDLRRSNPNNVTLDHVKPRYAGGTNDAKNLITACKPCNSGRGIKAVHHYATPGAVERIQRQRRQKLNMALAKAVLAGECSKTEALR